MLTFAQIITKLNPEARMPYQIIQSLYHPRHGMIYKVQWYEVIGDEGRPWYKESCLTADAVNAFNRFAKRRRSTHKSEYNKAETNVLYLFDKS